MSLSRRSFFTKLAGAAVAVKAAPSADIPWFTNGGAGNFGHGTMAMLKGSEAVIPLSPVSDELLEATAVDVGHFITLHLDGKELAKATASHLPAVLQRQGL
jgi:hypothetical protein